jgi:glycerol uptake facilitator-like aquaporin
LSIRNKVFKRFALINIGIGAFLCTGAEKVFADPNSALTSAKGQLDNQIKPIVNNVIVPVIATFLVVILVVSIARAVMAYRRGVDVELLGIVLLIVGIILVTTFPTWGWAMIG